jgi:anti-sigma factor RsiW
MPDCSAIKAGLGRYFDGELPPRERRLVEDHLKQCSRCSAELQELREIAGVFHQVMPTPPVPSDLTQRIMGTARAQVGSTARDWDFLGFWKNWSLSMRFAALAVAAAACYIGIVIGSSSLTSTRPASDEMKWIDMSSRGPIVTAYEGSAR